MAFFGLLNELFCSVFILKNVVSGMMRNLQTNYRMILYNLYDSINFTDNFFFLFCEILGKKKGIEIFTLDIIKIF